LDNLFVERLWRSLKHEDVYLRGYASVPELLLGLAAYFGFYNAERFHQSLDYLTPDAVYRTGSGGRKPPTQNQKPKQGSAVPLQVMAYPLKFDLKMSWLRGPL